MVEFKELSGNECRRLSLDSPAWHPVPASEDSLACRSALEPVFRLGILLIPGFSLIPVGCIAQALLSANRIAEKAVYSCTFLSEQDDEVLSDSGINFRCRSVHELESGEMDMIVVCAGMRSQSYHNSRIGGTLRRLHRSKVTVVAFTSGTFLLARAGLLDGRRCTVHWDFHDSFREEFPNCELLDHLFVIDNRLVTCAGETAALDFMINMIEAHWGHELARAVAAEALHTTRMPDAKQRDINRGMVLANTVVRRAVDFMEASAEDPVSPQNIADHLGVSLRHLERLCARHLQCSPARYYKRLRLERARRMLCQTGLSVSEIAVACGFVSQSHFAKSYSQCFGRSPTHDRMVRRRL